MKTGRRRQKKEAPATPEHVPQEPSRPKPVAAPTGAGLARGRARPSIVQIAFIIVVLVIAIIAIVMMSRACSGPQAAEYLPAETTGSWGTTIQVLAPQIVSGEGWRSDCDASGNCTILAGTCEMQERRDTFTEREIENYDDYAYSIYFEELTQELYEAAGDEFAVTYLNLDDDRWEGERHIVSEEWLDKETCEYTNFTVWITDPDDASDEVEVVLSECEVWDHVVVTEKVYEREEYCQTETVQGLTVLETLSEQGSGMAVDWPTAVTPQGGELQSRFEGVVLFEADGVEHTLTVSDPDAYVRYLTVPQYLGVDDEGRVVRVTDRVPEE
jgi:hypothetical protein